MQLSADTGRLICVRAGLARPAIDEVVDHRPVDAKTGGCSLFDHPGQRIFRQTAFRFPVSASDIRMDPCKPDLPDVLRDIEPAIERVWSEILWFCPLIQPEHPAPLVDRHRLPESLHARIGAREAQRLETEGQLLEAGHDD